MEKNNPFIELAQAYHISLPEVNKFIFDKGQSWTHEEHAEKKNKVWTFFINVVVKITVPYRCNSRSPPSLDDSLSKRRICDQPWHLWFELVREKYVRIFILRIVYGSSQHAHEKSFSEIKSLWSHNGVCFSADWGHVRSKCLQSVKYKKV